MTDETQEGPALASMLVAVEPAEDTVAFAKTRSSVLTKLFGGAPRPLSIDRYELVTPLGSGGQGDVYRAFDPKLDRYIALKIPHQAPTSAVGDILAEARAMAKMSHPNVVSVYDAGRDGPWAFLAMELVEGESLYAWQATATDGAAILDAYRQAANGLAAAHRAGIVHGDFKAGNVLVTEDRVAVTDFGLARLRLQGHGTTTDDADAEVTSIRGTFRYMAPEVKDGALATALSDQYSFCVSLREALGQHLDAFPHVRAIVDRGQSPEAGDRFESMAEVASLLGSRRWRTRLVRAIVGLACVGALVGTSAALWPDPPPPPLLYANDFSTTCTTPTCPERIDGVQGLAGHFDGETHFLELPELARVHPHTVTVAAWIRVATLEVDHQSIAAKPLGKTGEDSWELMLFDANGDGSPQLSFGISDGTDGRMASAPDGALEPGRWTFVAGTWDGTNVEVWIDGVARASVPAQRIEYDAHAAIVGADRDGGDVVDDLFHGDIDQLQVFGGALDQTQLRRLSDRDRGAPPHDSSRAHL